MSANELALETLKYMNKKYADGNSLRARHAIEALESQCASSRAMTGDQVQRKELIRDVFLRNGFTIKPGQDDLKDYVFAAANELLSIAVQCTVELEETWLSGPDNQPKVGDLCLIKVGGISQHEVYCFERCDDEFDDSDYCWVREDLDAPVPFDALTQQWLPLIDLDQPVKERVANHA
jgi:hypothetical protein